MGGQTIVRVVEPDPSDVSQGRTVAAISGADALGMLVDQAETAGASAVASAGSAATDATRAELARDLAIAAAPHYATLAAGEAATAVGDTFAVWPDGEALTFYRRTAGASTLLRRGPSWRDSIDELIGLAGATGEMIVVGGYHADSDDGGGLFRWDDGGSRLDHNGGTIIDPTKVFPSDWTNVAELDSWFAGTNGGTGVWRRVYEGAAVAATWFGLKGDYDFATHTGSDDSDAINAAALVAFCVELPDRFIKIKRRSIDLSFRFSGARITGPGGQTTGDEAFAGCVLFGDTGAHPVIDTIGSQGILLDGFAIMSGTEDPSAIGIQQARATTSQYTQFSVIEVPIRLASNPTANGGKGTIALLNVASELTEYPSANLSADTGLGIFADDSVIAPVSYYGTYGGPTSCSSIVLSGKAHLRSENPVGAPLWTKNVAALSGDLVYLVGLGTGSVGFRAQDFSVAWDVTFFPEFCDILGVVGRFEASHVKIVAQFSASRCIKTTSEADPTNPAAGVAMLNSTFEFRTSVVGGELAPPYWIKGSVFDVCRNLTVIAPRNPTTDYIVPTDEVFNRIDCSFVGYDDSSLTRELIRARSAVHVAGVKVLGAQGAALPADATDLATALTLVNAIKSRLSAHGIVA